ncbi:MAG: NADH-quinone oxidoreductase subunit C [Planctomycetaceae bacterium]
MSAFAEALDALAAASGGAVRRVEDLRGEHAFQAMPEAAHDTLALLRDHPELRCDFLAVLTAVDNHLTEPRFEVVYIVRSLHANVDVRVNVPVPGEAPELATVTDLWPAADWMEREVYDMFGVRFVGHPNLTRILMWEGFSGHPLRKDYPLLGNSPGTPGHLGKGGKR